MSILIANICMREAISATGVAESISSTIATHIQCLRGPVYANVLGGKPIFFDELDLRRIWDLLGESTQVSSRAMDSREWLSFSIWKSGYWIPVSNYLSLHLIDVDPTRIHQIMMMCTELTETVPVRYIALDVFSNEDEIAPLKGQRPSRPLPSPALDSGLRDVFWYNYFGPEYVALIGSERFQDLPMASVAEVQAGYRIVLNELPVVPPTDTFRAAQAEIRRRLGNELFADERQDPTVEGPEILVPDFYAKQRVLDEEHRIQRRKHAGSLTRTDLPKIPTSDILAQVRKNRKTT